MRGVPFREERGAGSEHPQVGAGWGVTSKEGQKEGKLRIRRGNASDPTAWMRSKKREAQ